ncbi:hypothetical protein VIBHAR_00874 [Vibrio campbellii ATCC BAA-1116]|uniref:Uncharacterized protein n=1 Tax=Vibrio campbellii (strain ATCC BAA-1116) TaxID=2902295 RepID=A7MWM2_VIBC1|nr:hypothetical protein VIBHAR_00874 [Vibrio campbellii ATCC BAA-1116]
MHDLIFDKHADGVAFSFLEYACTFAGLGLQVNFENNSVL